MDEIFFFFWQLELNMIQPLLDNMKGVLDRVQI